MPELRINIRLEGDAFVQDPDGEVVRILFGLINRMNINSPIASETLRHAASLFDLNGNRCGQVKVHEDD